MIMHADTRRNKRGVPIYEFFAFIYIFPEMSYGWPPPIPEEGQEVLFFQVNLMGLVELLLSLGNI